MGHPTPHAPVLLLLPAFSRFAEALDWARLKAVEHFGPVALESPRFDFRETHYYDSTMGPDLKKVFFAFKRLIDPTEIVAVKLATNRWEEEYAASHDHAERRPLNLDPGYLTPGKLVLATTKD